MDRQSEAHQQQCDPLVLKCLTAMDMAWQASFFRGLSFTQFISMPPDLCVAHGQVFVSRHGELLDRIAALCASAFSILGNFKPPGTFPVDEFIDTPEQKSFPRMRTPLTWMPENDSEFFAIDDPPSESTEAVLTGGGGGAACGVRNGRSCEQDQQPIDSERYQGQSFNSDFYTSCTVTEPDYYC